MYVGIFCAMIVACLKAFHKFVSGVLMKRVVNIEVLICISNKKYHYNNIKIVYTPVYKNSEN